MGFLIFLRIASALKFKTFFCCCVITREGPAFLSQCPFVLFNEKKVLHSHLKVVTGVCSKSSKTAMFGFSRGLWPDPCPRFALFLSCFFWWISTKVNNECEREGYSWFCFDHHAPKFASLHAFLFSIFIETFCIWHQDHRQKKRDVGHGGKNVRFYV